MLEGLWERALGRGQKLLGKHAGGSQTLGGGGEEEEAVKEEDKGDNEKDEEHGESCRS